MSIEEKNNNSVFENLLSVDVSKYIEQKNTGKTNLSYLSWANAVKETKKLYPDMNYNLIFFEGKPYLYDENLGYMVFTSVTIKGQTIEMWLPVMDGANYAMKKEPYVVHTKWEDKKVEAASMFDINKTLMRCLVKNIAMFGLGISLYAGEDLEMSDDDYDNIMDKADNTKLIKEIKKEKVEKQEETFTCETCGKVITPYKDGKNTYTPAMLVKNSQTKYGKNLCVACSKVLALSTATEGGKNA